MSAIKCISIIWKDNRKKKKQNRKTVYITKCSTTNVF